MKLSTHFLCDGCRRKPGQPHAADCKLVKPRPAHTAGAKGRKGFDAKTADYLARRFGG